MYEEALAQDPSAFDYDGVYDAMQADRAQPKMQVCGWGGAEGEGGRGAHSRTSHGNYFP